jgi:serine/threonine protein phosphatase PrpC
MTVSRCLGSFEYKSLEDYEMELKGGAKSFISCLPDIKAFDIDPESDEYILLSTDGFLEGSSY